MQKVKGRVKKGGVEKWGPHHAGLVEVGQLVFYPVGPGPICVARLRWYSRLESDTVCCPTALLGMGSGPLRVGVEMADVSPCSEHSFGWPVCWSWHRHLAHSQTASLAS